MLPCSPLYVTRISQYTFRSPRSLPPPALLLPRVGTFFVCTKVGTHLVCACLRGLPMHDRQFDPPTLLTPEQALLVLCLLFASLLILLNSDSFDISLLPAMFLETIGRYLPLWNSLKADDSQRYREKKRTRAERLGFRGGDTH